MSSRNNLPVSAREVVSPPRNGVEMPTSKLGTIQRIEYVQTKIVSQGSPTEIQNRIEYKPRETNGNVPPGPQNSSINILNSPNTRFVKVTRIDTHPSPIAPVQTPADFKFKYTLNTPPGSEEKTVDNELIEKTEDLKENVDTQLDMKYEHREILNQLEECRNMIRDEVENKKREIEESDNYIID
jgi:hypothetical protein